MAFVSTLKPPSPIECVIYADDTNVFWKIPKAEINTAKNTGQICADFAQGWSATNKMLLNISKTKMRLSLATDYSMASTPTISETDLDYVSDSSS